MKQFFLFAGLAFSLNGFAQKVTVKPTFQKGQKIEVLSKINSNVSMEMMGQSMETKVEATVNRSFDVENVQNGSTTLEHKIKRFQMNIEAPGGNSQSFDSEKPEDMKGEGGETLGKAIKSKFSMQVDPMGKVTSVKADDDYPGADQGNPMSGAMSNIGELPKVGSSMELVILPAAGVEKGTTWSDTTGGHQLAYTVTDVTGDEIALSFTDQTKTDKKQEMNGMELAISTTDKTTGTVRIDRK
ncbi:MAG: hypothetical protein EOO12_13075, partial [Chitinophagaceae bacterium]